MLKQKLFKFLSKFTPNNRAIKLLYGGAGGT